MRKLILFFAAVAFATLVFTITGYKPCQPHPAIVVEGRSYPPNDCGGPSFDNLMVAVMCIGVLAAIIRMVRVSRDYSAVGLGILGLLLIFLGTYGRGFTLTRLFGLPSLSLTELRVLRALLVVGGSLFTIGVFARLQGDRRGTIQLTTREDELPITK